MPPPAVSRRDEWAAIRVPRSVGLDAIAILGSRSGAVLADQEALYWFISPAAVSDWDVPGTRPVGVAAHLVIPPVRRTQGPGPHWRVCPGTDAWATDAAALRAALEDATRPRMVRR
ncbi:hypothetical protein OG786_29685 [Streptomyces sp. NBC_00101]|uniref:hypothetical protein n=1 Tax=Streptomyces sp. NBC_00101 TaxID=2975651 RepID=UPI003252661F